MKATINDLSRHILAGAFKQAIRDHAIYAPTAVFHGVIDSRQHQALFVIKQLRDSVASARKLAVRGLPLSEK